MAEDYFCDLIADASIYTQCVIINEEKLDDADICSRRRLGEFAARNT